MTREEAEKVCRKVIANHAGEELPENLFEDSVNMLMKEAEMMEASKDKPYVFGDPTVDSHKFDEIDQKVTNVSCGKLHG